MSKRSTSILDLADVPHWLQVARKAVSTSIPAAVRRIVVRGDPDRMYDDTISYLLRAGDAVRDCRTVAEWDQAFERVFAEFYSAIRAFHACRPESIESYKRFGIRRLCRSRAEATAIAAFSKHIAKEQIIEAVKKHPILREDEVVYCFTDQKNAKNSSANHYLQCGSEYLQGVAVGLGLHGRGILAEDDVDRQDFLKTLAEACQKTGFQVHAYCLMRNHFHLVVETPNANLVAGMRWLLSSYTIRLNHRHKLFGHVFSGS